MQNLKKNLKFWKILKKILSKFWKSNNHIYRKMTETLYKLVNFK